MSISSLKTADYQNFLVARYVHSLVKAEESNGISSTRVVVAGFSQGAAVALLSLRSDTPLAGVLSLSGYLTLANEPQLVSSENKATRLLMCHGDLDQVVSTCTALI